MSKAIKYKNKIKNTIKSHKKCIKINVKNIN